MAIYGINYKGLHKRKNYEQLFDYLQNNQDMIRYPDRFAKQMRNHPYLTQFDSEEFGYMDTQQKEIKKKDAETSTIQEQAAQPNAPSTTDLLARQPPRPLPTGFGQHLNVMGGPQAGRMSIPQSYGDTEVPLPVNQQPRMNRILVHGGPSDISSIRPYAMRDDEVPLPVNQQPRMNRILVNGGPRVGIAIRPRALVDNEVPIPITSRLADPSPSGRINRVTPNRGDYMSIDSPTTGTLLDHANAILQTAGAVMHINGTPTADPRIANPFNSLRYLNADVVGVPRNLRSVLESEALPNILYDPRPYESSISDVDRDDFSDFSSVVNDFIHTVVERHLDQRSSISEGSFQELPYASSIIGTERNEIDPGTESESNKSEKMRQLNDFMLGGFVTEEDMKRPAIRTPAELEGPTTQVGGSSSSAGVDVSSFKGAEVLIETFMNYGIFNMLGETTTLYNIRKISNFKEPQFSEIFNLCVNFIKENKNDISQIIGQPKNNKGYSKYEKAHFIHTIAGGLNSSIKSLIQPKEETKEEPQSQAKQQAKSKVKKYSTPQSKPKAKPKAKQTAQPSEI